MVVQIYGASVLGEVVGLVFPVLGNAIGEGKGSGIGIFKRRGEESGRGP
jgi:hypothetical protein